MKKKKQIKTLPYSRMHATVTTKPVSSIEVQVSSSAENNPKSCDPFLRDFPSRMQIIVLFYHPSLFAQRVARRWNVNQTLLAELLWDAEVEWWVEWGRKKTYHKRYTARYRWVLERKVKKSTEKGINEMVGEAFKEITLCGFVAIGFVVYQRKKERYAHYDCTRHSAHSQNYLLLVHRT